MFTWLTGSLFWLGAVVLIIGLWLLISPASFLKTGNLLGRWVSTDSYFETLDRPRFQERAIYKYHRGFGALIFSGALYSMVILMMTETDIVIDQLPVIVNRHWSEWFYLTLYSILIGANGLAAVVGLLVFIRPSLIKGIEQVLNKWIGIEQKLKKLDERHEISLSILPGSPRLFGLAVSLAGIYMMLSLGILFL